MKKNSIGVKIALWYGLLISILITSLFFIFYGLLRTYMFDELKNQIQSNAESVASDLNLDSLPDYKLPSNLVATILDTKGQIILKNNNLTWTDDSSYKNNAFWHKTSGSNEWLVYDKVAKLSNSRSVIIRICASQKSMEEMLSFILIMMIIGGVCFVAFAIIGGLTITSRAVSPISKIINTAKEIEHGDLSKRIVGVKNKDEVGMLTENLNSMLGHLEASFNREKQFACDASHELRTPLAIIMNTSEQLIKSTKDNIPEEYLSIYDESLRMEKIISHLLLLTRGDEDKYQLTFEHIDIGEVISSVIDQLDDYRHEHQVTIAYSNTDNIYINADQTLLTHLFLNLIQNAIKYSIQGGFIKVHLSENQEQITVSVTDNGIGISTEDLPHIFERFYRADKARDRTGTGLGLSIVKWIVDMHHGEIEVTSESGKNTVFTVTFWKSIINNTKSLN